MRDYEELVRDLREADEKSMCGECGMNLHGGTTKKGVLFAEAADAIEELQKALDVVNDAHNEGYDVGYWAGRRDYEPKWISVEERLPEESANYLTYGVFLPLGVKAMDLCRFNGKGWVTAATVEITHWMPLPEPPKEDADA